MAWREEEVERIAQGIEQSVDFGAQSAFPAPDRLAFAVFLGARTVLMGMYDGAVDHGVLIVSLSSQKLKHPLPHAALGPAQEASVDLGRIAKALRRFPPREARSVAVENGFNEQPVVPGRDPDMALAARNMSLIRPH